MLPTQYQQLIHLSRYARWNEDTQQRETWEQTTQRYFDFFIPHLAENHDFKLTKADYRKLLGGVQDLKVLPSMRCLMTAGPALTRDHICGYNCAYRPVNDQRAFDEIMYILMCATGVGFSVERQYVNQLPTVPEDISDSTIIINVRDSKRGWAESYRELLGLLYAGRIPSWDVSQVRPAGARLSVMGGRASGPAPLVDLFAFTIQKFKGAEGRKLTSIECHDIVCKIGECVVVGGVRRSALISLSNLSDQRMRDAKSGDWWVLDPQRQISNNSVAYSDRPDVGPFMEEWLSIYHSKAGERGIFNREAARQQAVASGRRRGFWTPDDPIAFGTNPCSEIILRPEEFCNLSTNVVRFEDDFESLAEKIRLSTILGTWQSTLTDFKYIGKHWRENCEEERLLGVSMTGIMDNMLLAGRGHDKPLVARKMLVEVLEELKKVAVETNKDWAERLNIPQSTAITCVKPEGTASQLVSAGSGIHPRYSEYYIRRIRQDVKDPVTTLLIDQGVANEIDQGNKENIVFDFPMHIESDSVFRNDLTAIEQLEHWKIFQDHWCEHKPSITTYVRENEWPAVGGWVYDHFDQMSGVAFLPHSDHVYKQAPYEEISETQYHELQEQIPVIDWTRLPEYESEDNTSNTRELACSSGHCDL